VRLGLIIGGLLLIVGGLLPTPRGDAT